MITIITVTVIIQILNVVRDKAVNNNNNNNELDDNAHNNRDNKNMKINLGICSSPDVVNR